MSRLVKKEKKDNHIIRSLLKFEVIVCLRVLSEGYVRVFDIVLSCNVVEVRNCYVFLCCHVVLHN